MRSDAAQRDEIASRVGQLVIRQASVADTKLIVSMLIEAAKWVEQLDGTIMWVEGELEEQRIRADVAEGMFVVAEIDSQAVGTMRLQLEDHLFWPDLEGGDSAFVHRA